KPIFRSPEGTIYLNAASVPRIVENDGEKLRNFSIVTLEAGVVSQVSLVWVGNDFQVAKGEILYERSRIVS
ncbi:MAG: TIGR04168 family protein, partial [Nostoc sp. NMS4]|nr:TIGR04168 family protein [Nostoc sp. NMS4]